jgi:GH43 family beta-xylosidase
MHFPSVIHRARGAASRASVGLSRREMTTLGVEQLESRIALAGEGLTAQYFHNADFTGLALERSEAVNFDWGTASPIAGMNANSFSVRWTGQLEAKFTETYTIRTVSDDGVRLWIDGKLLIDNWDNHVAEIDTATIALEGGKRYDVRLEYYDNSGVAEIRLQWQSASQPLEAIPATHLYASPAGVWGEYWDAFCGQGARLDSQIDFNWGTGRPLNTIAVDSFNIRWTGLIRPEHSEQYTFRTTSDEAVRVWIGDELIIDHWTPHATSTLTGVKTLEAGKWYDIRVEYRDVAGHAEVELSWSSDSQTGGQFEVVPSENLRALKHSPLFASNPLGPGQDPFVIRWQDSYLHVHSAGGSVWIEQSKYLQDVDRDDPDNVSVRAWRPPTGTNYSSQIWAPELHQINGKWYIYVAASDGDNATHRMHVLERNDPNPMGPYTYKGQLAATTDRWAIDGTVLQWQGELYFIWSGWPGTANVQQNLYIARMSNPWTISGERVLLAEPQLSWERHGLPINEGPQVLINDGKLHIIYSASGYWRQEYSLGRLTYNGTGDIMSRSSWTKAPSPVFQATSEVVGVGHASFTKSPDGTQDWIVYHAHPSPGGNPDARVIRIQQFTYFANGNPNFGVPLPANSVVEIESGHADPDRKLLAGDFDASGAVNATDLGVWKAQYATEIFPGRAVDGADFLKWQQNVGATAPANSAVSAVAASSVTVAAPSAELVSDPPPSKGWEQPSTGDPKSPERRAVVPREAIRGGISDAWGYSSSLTRFTFSTESDAAGLSQLPVEAMISLINYARRREQAVDAAFSRLPARLEQHKWTSLSEARIRGLGEAAPHDILDDYRIGASGARLMSTPAGKSLGTTLPGPLGVSLAIDPASP